MKIVSLFVLAVILVSVNGFTTPTPRSSIQRISTQTPSVSFDTSLSMGRQWNFNEGRGPFGLKKNAEIWNGRFAQMCFVVVLLQELVTGKGVIQGIQEGNPINIAMLGLTAFSGVALTAFLAIKGKDKFIDLSE
jgi:hypothetical protein